jgi:hypothetical protein
MKVGSGDIQIRTVLAIAGLGVAGFCAVTACASAGPASSQPGPSAAARPALAASASSEGIARDIAGIAVGKGGLPALNNGLAQATSATCDPGTVPNRPQAGAPVSASCGILYSDGSVWRRTITVTFDGHGNPVADRANLGDEVLSPSTGW